MPERPGDRLPRPWPVGPNPGPWRVEEESPGLWVVIDAGYGHICECVEEEDATQIASMPDLWAAHDAERARADEATARAERAEAALAEAVNVIDWLLRDFHACTPGAETQVSVGQAEALLARHGYGEAGDG